MACLHLYLFHKVFVVLVVVLAKNLREELLLLL